VSLAIVTHVSHYRCEHCEAVLEHPEGVECGTVDGHCARLTAAGWRPVWLRVSLETPTGEQQRHIFSRGGWICSQCAESFNKVPKRRRRSR